MKLRILFVDDDTSTLSALSCFMRKSYDIHTATGGATVLKLITYLPRLEHIRRVTGRQHCSVETNKLATDSPPLEGFELKETQKNIENLALKELSTGMLLYKSIVTLSGTLIISKGLEITKANFNCLKTIAPHRCIKEPVYIMTAN